MDSNTVHAVITNLRDPVNIKKRIHFTSRAIRLITFLFENKHIDVIKLHCLLLQLAYHAGCFNEDRTYINMRNVVTFLMIDLPECITLSDIKNVGSRFNIKYDSEYHEVRDMKLLLDQI